MQRYNEFNLIHKALRAMLYDTALTLQQTYFADSNEAEKVLDKVEDVLFLFEHHAHHEDSFILPAVAKYEPALVDEFEKEHETDLKLSSNLKNLLNIYRNVNFTAEMIAMGSAISKAFVEFMIFNLEHMAKEEMLLNSVMWQHYTDEQLIDINRRLVATIPADEMALASGWMMRGINFADAISWLNAVRSSGSPMIYASLLRLAEKEMSAELLDKVMDVLQEKAKVA